MSTCPDVPGVSCSEVRAERKELSDKLGLHNTLTNNILPSFPLSTHFAHTYVKNNVALVGDAAHGVHPMAGQGLNLGLGDVEELVRRVGVAVEAGGEPGDKLQMGIYGEKRRRKVGVVQAGIHGLREVFNFQGLGGIGRAVGMAGVNMLPGVKDKLKQAAMGF